MKTNFFSLLVILVISFFISSNEYNFIDIQKLGYDQYQPIFINGKIVKEQSKDHRSCEPIYIAIKKILDQFNRSFTMLDLGASQGYYSFKAAHDYNCFCVMIEGNNEPFYPLVATQLFDLCMLNDLDNIIFLENLIDVKKLQHLSECEHFDVVLALNFVHWFDDQWQEALDAILNLGSHVIIENPPYYTASDPKIFAIRKEIDVYLQKKNAQILAAVPWHILSSETILYFIESNKRSLKRKTWNSKIVEDAYEIISTYNEKYIIKFNNSLIKKLWIPGINFSTFLQLNGIYPTKKMLVEDLEKLKNSDNILIQGKFLI